MQRRSKIGVWYYYDNGNNTDIPLWYSMVLLFIVMFSLCWCISMSNVSVENKIPVMTVSVATDQGQVFWFVKLFWGRWGKFKISLKIQLEIWVHTMFPLCWCINMSTIVVKLPASTPIDLYFYVWVPDLQIIDCCYIIKRSCHSSVVWI